MKCFSTRTILKVIGFCLMGLLFQACNDMESELTAEDLKKEFVENIADVVIAVDDIFPVSNKPASSSVPCETVDFGACTNGQKSKNYNLCTMGSGYLSGSALKKTVDENNVLIPNCEMSVPLQSFLYSTSHSYGTKAGTASIISTAQTDGGYKLTFSSGSLAEPVYAVSLGEYTKLIDPEADNGYNVVAKTKTNLTLTSNKRGTRVLTGGELEFTNQKSNEVCSVTVTDVSWKDTLCNCPTAGTLSGQCQIDGVASNQVEIKFQSVCGKAEVKYSTVDLPELQLTRCNEKK